METKKQRDVHFGYLVLWCEKPGKFEDLKDSWDKTTSRQITVLRGGLSLNFAFSRVAA